MSEDKYLLIPIKEILDRIKDYEVKLKRKDINDKAIRFYNSQRALLKQVMKYKQISLSESDIDAKAKG